MRVIWLSVCAACAPQGGVVLLGNGSHDLSALEVREVTGLPAPHDLAFNPDVEPIGDDAGGQLWVVGPDDDAVSIVQRLNTSPVVSRRSGPESRHFLAHPSSLAFGAPGFLATAQETTRRTQPTTPGAFMGPTLWTSDPAVFDGGVDSHFDMLHNSPNGAGIAWEADNVYWVFDGAHAALTRYDFAQDHGPAGTDHSDGVMARWVEGEVAYVPGVASHLVMDGDRLFAADTGNQRVAMLDTTSGVPGADIRPNYDGGQQFRVDGGALETLIDAEAGEFVEPSGVELHDGLLYVSDHAGGRISAFSLDGVRVDYLDLEPGSAPQGMAFGPDGHLWVADAARGRVIELWAGDRP